MNIVAKSLVCFLIFTGAVSAEERCEWATEKSLWLHEMKTKYGFPFGALSNFATASVQAERTDSIVVKAKLEGFLLATVELLFDPETVFLIDGTFSPAELRDIFYEACEEAL